VRVRGTVLLGVGLAYLSGCVLLVVAPPEAGAGLRLVGLTAMCAAYGSAAAALFLPKRKRLRTLELALLLVLGIAFRLTLLVGCPAETVGAGVAAATPAATAPPLERLLAVLLSFLEPKAWIGSVLMLLLELGSWAALLLFLERAHRPTAWLLLYMWHPVAVLASGAGASSTATVFFLVLALWLLRVGRTGRGVMSLGLGASGSYLTWPAFAALVAGSLRKGLVGALVLGAVGLSVAALAWAEPEWGGAFCQTVVSGTRNAGLFALAAWVTGSRWFAWAIAGLLCAGVGWVLRKREPTDLFNGTLRAAVLVSPVVRSGDLHVLLPMLVLRPSVVWAAFPCVVLLLEARWLAGDAPVHFVAAEYGVLALGLVLEWVLGRRPSAKQGAS